MKNGLFLIIMGFLSFDNYAKDSESSARKLDVDLPFYEAQALSKLDLQDKKMRLTPLIISKLFNYDDLSPATP